MNVNHVHGSTFLVSDVRTWIRYEPTIQTTFFWPRDSYVIQGFTLRCFPGIHMWMLEGWDAILLVSSPEDNGNFLQCSGPGHLLIGSPTFKTLFKACIIISILNILRSIYYFLHGHSITKLSIPGFYPSPWKVITHILYNCTKITQAYMLVLRSRRSH